MLKDHKNYSGDPTYDQASAKPVARIFIDIFLENPRQLSTIKENSVGKGLKWPQDFV